MISSSQTKESNAIANCIFSFQGYIFAFKDEYIYFDNRPNSMVVSMHQI